MLKLSNVPLLFIIHGEPGDGKRTFVQYLTTLLQGNHTPLELLLSEDSFVLGGYNILRVSVYCNAHVLGKKGKIIS